MNSELLAVAAKSRLSAGSLVPHLGLQRAALIAALAVVRVAFED